MATPLTGCGGLVGERDTVNSYSEGSKTHGFWGPRNRPIWGSGIPYFGPLESVVSSLERGLRPVVPKDSTTRSVTGP